MSRSSGHDEGITESSSPSSPPSPSSYACASPKIHDGENRPDDTATREHGNHHDDDDDVDDANGEEIDAATLEMMMAFQERQDRLGNDEARNGDDDNDYNGNAGVADDDNDDDDDLHPRLEFLDQYGDLEGDDDADGVVEDAPPDGPPDLDADADADANANANANEHPHRDNPAAVALRRHQLLHLERQRLQNDPGQWNRHHPFLLRCLTSLLPPSLLRYKPLSLLAAVALLHSTLRTRQQFYLAMTHVQSSKLAYVVFGNAFLTLAVATFDAATHLFLEGGLRRNERDAIGERIRWDVTETCLALTMFRSELDAVTAGTFAALVVSKCLHWSAELRGSHLRMTEEVFAYPASEDAEDERDGTPRPWHRRLPRPRVSHMRFYALLLTLLFLDVFAVAHCAVVVTTDGPSVHILFGFEAAILMVSALHAMGMYHLHVIDGIVGALCHWCEGDHHYCPVGGMAAPDDEDVDENENENENENETERLQGSHNNHDNHNNQYNQNSLARKLVHRLADPWKDRRATFSFLIELQAQSAKFLFYLVFFAIVFTYYGMPINIFREVYVSFQQLRSRIVAFHNYRKLTRNMDARFDDIRDEEELERLGRTCIICRDQMDWKGGCKKLPGCGHAFHKHCLREWMVQQQTCPTCRADIAANEARMRRREAAVANAVAVAVEGANEEGLVVEGDMVEGAEGGVPAERPTGQSGDDVDDGENQRQLPDEGDDMQIQRTADDDHLETLSSTQSPPQTTQENGSNAAASPAATPNASSNPSSQWQPPTQTPLQAFSPASNTDSRPHFPCLYRIRNPRGAQVFSLDAMSAAAFLPRRIVPESKLVVCLAIEYWPVPFREVMYRIPDGFVRACDVERYLPLTVPDVSVASVGCAGMIGGDGKRVRAG